MKVGVPLGEGGSVFTIWWECLYNKVGVSLGEGGSAFTSRWARLCITFFWLNMFFPPSTLTSSTAVPPLLPPPPPLLSPPLPLTPPSFFLFIFLQILLCLLLLLLLLFVLLLFLLLLFLLLLCLPSLSYFVIYSIWQLSQLLYNHETSILKFFLQTDRPTDRPTKVGIEAPPRSLKICSAQLSYFKILGTYEFLSNGFVSE